MPAIGVSWEDAQQFVRWLSRKTGRTYRLLSEAEWEYAARAGSQTPFFTGPTITAAHANFSARYVYSGSAPGLCRQGTIEVGTLASNPFGLFDMNGNVAEWVQDVWRDSYEGAPTDGSAWMDSGDPARRVVRGGSWSSEAWYVRSASRGRGLAVNRNVFNGFRVARAL